MRIKAILIFSLFLGFFSSIQEVNADVPYVMPELKSFDFSPKEIDLIDQNPKIVITLKVFHPAGIKSQSVKAWIRKSNVFETSVVLNRTDSPIVSTLNEVTFKGTWNLENVPGPGVYQITTDGVSGIGPTPINFPTSGSFSIPNFRDMSGAENSLLVRNYGNLNFDFVTFVGPTFDSPYVLTDGKNRRLYDPAPVWRVNEIFDPSKYFELRTSSVNLEISSSTPEICTSNGKILKLIGIGTCKYKVFTKETKDYLEKSIDLIAQVGVPRIKPIIAPYDFPNQTVENLPKTLQKLSTFANNGALVIPVSLTPAICIGGDRGIQILAGGTCKLKYSLGETNTNLAADDVIQTFEVVRNSQTLTFAPPKTAEVSSKTLSLVATSSAGLAISYSAKPDSVCTVNGPVLNLIGPGNCQVTASSIGSATIAPASITTEIIISGAAPVVQKPSVKKITCTKGKLTKNFNGTKCPAGYKKKK